MANHSKKPPKKPSPEELGKMLVNIYESGYLDHGQTYKMSFIKGVFGGLGGALGATLLVALIIWLLSLFSDVPLVGQFIENLRHTLNTKPN